MRGAAVYYEEFLAGVLTETDEGEYLFQYDAQYVREHRDKFITFSMPVSPLPYREKRLFPLFEGLIPEGWLLDIASTNWKLKPNDRMGLLLTCCRACVGAVSVEPINEDHEA